jgi:hypothetical protein
MSNCKIFAKIEKKFFCWQIENAVTMLVFPNCNVINCFFFSQEWTPHFLRFYLFYTVMILAAPQETVGKAGIEPGTAA